jgi:hypothetical protein
MFKKSKSKTEIIKDCYMLEVDIIDIFLNQIKCFEKINEEIQNFPKKLYRFEHDERISSMVYEAEKMKQDLTILKLSRSYKALLESYSEISDLFEMGYEKWIDSMNRR